MFTLGRILLKISSLQQNLLKAIVFGKNMHGFSASQLVIECL